MTGDSPAALASALRRTVEGPMWHGPALGELLRDVSHEQAAAHPVAGAHSIWELVLHMIAWAEICRERMEDRELDSPPPQRDWPPPPAPTAQSWSESVERLTIAYAELARAARTRSEEQLRQPVGDGKYTVAVMLHGVVEHGCYHGGQIAILRRALEGSSA